MALKFHPLRRIVPRRVVPASSAVSPPLSVPRPRNGEPSSLFKTRTRSLAHHIAQGLQLRPELLAATFKSRNITLPHFEFLVELLREKDLVHALESMGLLESGGEEREIVPCPVWFFLSLPALLDHSSQSPYLASLLLSPRFRDLAQQEQVIFLSRSIQHFLKVKDYVAVRETVEWICWNQIHFAKSAHFAKFLEALTSHRSRAVLIDSPGKEVLWPLAAMLRRAMRDRNVEPTLATFSPLFRPALIPSRPQDAYQLLSDIATAGLELESSALHSVMKVFADHGEVAGAEKIMLAIETDRIAALERKKEAARGKASASAKVKVERPSKVLSGERSEEYHARRDQVKKDKWVEKARNRQIAAAESLPTEKSDSAFVTSFPFLVNLPAKTDDNPYPTLTPPVFPTIDNLDQGESTSHRSRPSFPSKHVTTLLSAHRNDPLSAFAYYDELQKASPDTPLDPQNRIILLSIASRSNSVDSERLLRIFSQLSTPAAPRPLKDPPTSDTKGNYRKGAAMHGNRSRTITRMYTITMQGLLNRSEPELALKVWEQALRRSDVQPDAVLLLFVLRAYIAQDDLLGAEMVLARHGRIIADEGSRNSNRNDSRDRTRVKLDIVIINQLLSAYNRSGNYSSVYDLFLNLRSRYSLSPDAASLAILLDSARYASASAGNGFGPGLEDLHLSNSGVVSDIWGGQSAWRVAEAMMWDVLARAWPEVGRCLVDPGKDRDYSTEIRDWWKGSSGAVATVDEVEKAGEGRLARVTKGEAARPFAATLSIEPPLHPSLYPTPRVFRAFIQLIGYHANTSSISRVLAWMRAIDSKPDRSTLVLALLYLGEGGYSDTKRRRIREWLIDWLGYEQVPLEEEVAEARSGRKA